ncbi:PH domain-containing protein [Actinomyces sp.]|uniref:PH domain-containing protein n=1 Tax=Actinomyces sp. TaxID=29317 RepID=UPI0026DA74E8|nr:PH domain-containing protein [Actinomyces sp.]MDO4655756.1 PH domain-containing protein [Actinomyces sp.]
MSPSWESRLEAARKARTDAAGESGSAASRDLPLPENVAWHRVSLVTPVLEGWKIVTGVLAFVTVQNLDDLVRAYRFISEHGFSLGGQIGYYLLGLVALIALWVVLGLLSWWRRAYAVDADGVYLRSGILSRKLRTARLPRIQSVDVVHPLLGRIFGLGQLTVEVAGGRNSRVVIGFLTTSELQTLRDRILDLAAGQIDLPGAASEDGAVHASGTGHDTGGIKDLASTAHPEGLTPEEATGSEAASAPAPRTSQLRASHFQEHPLYSVDSATLLGSLLRHPMTYTLLLAIVGTLVVGILIIVTDSMTGSEALTIISSYITMVIALATMVWNQFNSAWNFHAAATPSGIRMSYGLTAETSRTLPPGRVHGVGLTGPILWRRKDWWKVDVTVAGRDERPHDGQTREIGNLLLPVGSRDTALRALWLVVPDLGVPDPDRLLIQALTGRDDDGVGDPQASAGSAERGFVRISCRGRIFRPLTWRRAAVILTDTCVIIRHGRWRRRVAVFPYERIQSLRVRQGPLARRRGLASLRLDMVAQEVPASITNLDAAEAKALAARISQRALHRARAVQLDRWLARAVAATQPAGPSVR